MLAIPFSTAALATPAERIADYPQHGLRFSVPAGWTGREVEAGVLLVSSKVPGLVLLTTHAHRDLESLGADARAGLGDGSTTALTLRGTLEPLGTTGIGGEFRGRVEGSPATAYVVGLVNPHGDGVSVMAATSPEKFSPEHKAIALAIARSVEFYLPKSPSIVQEWRAVLADSRLARHVSSYGSGSSGYSGFQSSQAFHLCAAGHFMYRSRESGSFDAPGAFGSTQRRDTGEGQWQIVADDGGRPWLQLRYRSGAVENHALELRNGKTYLNGARHFRTATDLCR